MSISPAKDIILSVARQHGLTLEDLTGLSHKTAFVIPRHIAMKRVRNELGYSFPKIGRLFNRHHATVLMACRGGRPDQCTAKRSLARLQARIEKAHRAIAELEAANG